MANVSDHELVPPPPPDSPPPPPDAPPPPPASSSGQGPELSGSVGKDNPIALASLIVALLALLLAIVIIGGLVAIVALVMAFVGLKRSKTTNSGRGLAIGAVLLSLLSIAASAGATTILVRAVQSGDFDIGALISNGPDNDEFPPEEDVIDVVCSDDGLALATISVENPTEARQLYTFTVTWDSTSGEELAESFQGDVVAPGEMAEFRIFQRSPSAIVETCAVTDVRRAVSLFG